MMMGPVLVNGRFLSQPVTGVQRFAAEIVGAIDALMARREWPKTSLLAARGGTLINLGNTAPLSAGSGQVVVIHDAGVFDTPASYSWTFRLWYKSLQRALAKAAARIATVSEFSRQRIAACLGIDSARITVIDEGADHILRTPAELRALYENAACLLFPSRYEGFGLPPVEAMACGCPVIAAGGGAVEEVCGDSALHFDSDAPRSLTSVVERLLEEPGLAANLRARGLRRVSALSWVASARKLANVVESVS